MILRTPPHPLDPTHDPALRSWVASANVPDADFPIQNLPLGVFAESAGDPGRIGIAIGDRILDVIAALEAGVFTSTARDVAERCRDTTLNALLATGPSALRVLRFQASAFLRMDNVRAARDRTLAHRLLVPMGDALLRLPLAIGDYTDFYASIDHATNVGALMRPDNPLLPNYKYVPIGYHGRASSVIVSGTSIRRPNGQIKAADADAPTFGPTRALDYEAEVGFIIGSGNALGIPIPMHAAEEHLAGICLVNDWSARDTQIWEYQPLGPFLSKSFGTTISPWIVTFDALAPFRVPAAARPATDPAPLPYLSSTANEHTGAIDLVLDVAVRSQQMRERAIPALRLGRVRLAGLYWTPAQMVTHHTSNGCNLRPGDLLASGTISGPSPEERGCLLELTQRGTRPIQLPSGEQRGFLEDGDEVILHARCERPGVVAIGFGTCRGMVTPARAGAESPLHPVTSLPYPIV